MVLFIVCNNDVENARIEALSLAREYAKQNGLNLTYLTENAKLSDAEKNDVTLIQPENMEDGVMAHVKWFSVPCDGYAEDSVFLIDECTKDYVPWYDNKGYYERIVARKEAAIFQICTSLDKLPPSLVQRATVNIIA